MSSVQHKFNALANVHLRDYTALCDTNNEATRQKKKLYNENLCRRLGANEKDPLKPFLAIKRFSIRILLHRQRHKTSLLRIRNVHYMMTKEKRDIKS